MKTILLSLSFLFITHIFLSQEIPDFSGLRPDTVTYKRSVKSTLGPGRHTFPKRFSLVNYAPDVKSQSPWGTCVGYSAAYCAMSIAYMLENGEPVRFSPYSLYNRLKMDAHPDTCDYGLYVDRALEALKTKGCARWDNYENICKEDLRYSPYSDKISNFNPVTVSVHDFKHAITNYEPIVFAMRCFYDSVNRKKSLSYYNINSEGKWICEPSTYDFVYGGHAMCIIGYDDDKFGGSFLVQNSWGKDWGVNGRFWIPYSQITYCDNYYSHPSNGNIDEAYSITTNPNFLDDFVYEPFEDELDDDRLNEFTLLNNTSTVSRVWLSIAYKTYEGWVSEGWWSCDLNSEVTVDISNRVTDDIYYRIEGPGNNYVWAGDQSRVFCVSDDAFYYPENKSNCPRNRYFGKYKGTSGRLSIILSDPSRGDTGEGSMEIVNLENNPNKDPIDANKNWNGEYALFDPIDNSPIILDPSDKDKDYLIWVISKKDKPKEFIGSLKDITELKTLKFASEKNANIHLAFIKSEAQNR